MQEKVQKVLHSVKFCEINGPDKAFQLVLEVKALD